MTMSRLAKVFWLTAVFGFWAYGCGGGTPKVGDACSQAGFWCESGAAALECRMGFVVNLPCRGPGGCQRMGSSIHCDMTNNLEGDLCASTADGLGLCTPDGKATLECRQGAFVKTNTCTSCTVNGDRALCQ
jgi:hypothetical protein